MTITFSELEVRNILYVKLDESMNLSITVNEPIYRGDHLNQKIIYLIPAKVGEIDMKSATVYLSYIRADLTADIALLLRMDEMYQDRYYQYKLPVTTNLSRYPGEICTWLQIFSGPPKCPIVAKSGECILHIMESKNMDEYISDRNLRLIYEMQKHMEDKIEKTGAELEERIENGLSQKADNIIFDPETSTIQLVSTQHLINEDGEEEQRQNLIGDPIFVRADDNSSAITNIEINELGELVVTLEDESTRNLGRVVGKDGAVYVPHVDVHKVLTFTVETEPDSVPDPVDLNPNDEWVDMGAAGSQSDYVWESM